MKQEQIEIGGKVITIETGRIAKQADGAVIVRQGGSVVLVTAVSSDEERKGISFFPLTVEYRERSSAGGSIPGGYFRREGRPAEHEILAARMIDRSIRPLFPKGYRCETVVYATILSAESESEPEALAIIGAAAALHLSDIPWAGPIAGVRVAKVDGSLIAFPTREERERATIDLVISSGTQGLAMVEGKAKEASEEDVIDALMLGQEASGKLLDLIERWRTEIGRPKRSFDPPTKDEELIEKVRGFSEARMREALVIPGKLDRHRAIDDIKRDLLAELEEAYPDREGEIKEAFGDLEYQIVRKMIVEEKRRVDERGMEDVRSISGEVRWLPRAHGSAIFTRGETQSLSTCTLGTGRDEQWVETLYGDEKRRFLLHYNFPSFSVGETRPERGPGRREIGHGVLARRALDEMLPDAETFPYTIRIVSDISESNGSSSMATVCGGCMALMDAGVPIERPTAGIAMGLIQEGEEIAILSDILGDEDHLGDMDFKVAGTSSGITALQMDNKVGGLDRAVLDRALDQARRGRLHILEEMKKIIDAPRDDVADHAPRFRSTRIRVERIRDIIGPGGRVIQGIQMTTGSKIDVEDDGLVRIYATTKEAAEAAFKEVKKLTGEPEVGKVYRGTITGVKEFGAFVKIFPNIEGLVHISEMEQGRIERIDDVAKEGEEMIVRVLGVDNRGKLRLSRKDALDASPDEFVNCTG